MTKNNFFYLLLFTFVIVSFCGCNSTDNKINRLKEIREEKKHISGLENYEKIFKLNDEEREILKELKNIRHELTADQLKILEEDEKYYTNGIATFNVKNYSQAKIYFNQAISRNVTNDSINAYIEASDIHIMLNEIEAEKKTKEPYRYIILTNTEKIFKLLFSKTLKLYDNKIDLFSKAEKEIILKKLKKDIDKYYYLSYKNVAIKLKTSSDGIVQYKEYFEKLQKHLVSMEDANNAFQIFNNPQIKKLYNSVDNENKKAYSSYKKYGQPTLFDLEYAAKSYLKQTMNNPSSSDIVEKEAFAKQTNSGYIYRMKVRGENAFGATITRIYSFDCRYNASANDYYCNNSF